MEAEHVLLNQKLDVRGAMLDARGVQLVAITTSLAVFTALIKTSMPPTAERHSSAAASSDSASASAHEPEEIVEQERDVVLGSCGSGRLASCFLDSMAILDSPSWGYGLRYKYGLQKQRITEARQEEVTEAWLEKFSPWEVARYDIVFPVRLFYDDHVDPNSSRKGIGEEVIHAVAYDVPILGYKTKNTNSLRLW
ncbi:unnamed protein product [Cuscuta europaea]|uniref:Alpha-1,4 glucan phosphorylase n=1 Tax=Cuscuta europaea TaxID=41803 RepID=A0A9P0YJ90_CUSEU|nr:unnamed protein product [Cuscuta europaea]